MNGIFHIFILNNRYQKQKNICLFHKLKLGEGAFSITYFSCEELNKILVLLNFKKNIQKKFITDIFYLLFFLKIILSFQIILILLMKKKKYLDRKFVWANFKDIIPFL